MPSTNDIYDVNKIRQDAAKSIEDGAVTKDYPLDIKKACELLNEALASEILCVLRYRHHQIVSKGINFPQVAAEFGEHAVDEERHMIMIAERIDQLGGDPDFNPATIAKRSSTEYGTSGPLMVMIKEDLVAERIAIEVYRKMIAFFGDKDSTTRRMLEEILEEEEEHASDLSDLLVTVEGTEKKHQERFALVEGTVLKQKPTLLLRPKDSAVKTKKDSCWLSITHIFSMWVFSFYHKLIHFYGSLQMEPPSPDCN